MDADAATNTTASTVMQRMVISEILCYIQSKMNTTEHDFIIKTVVDFYSEDDIHEAKILLFEECIETNMRLKTYRKEAAKHDCVDMINKLNEIGANCSTFVAANLNHIPTTTADSFDLSKLCRNIEMVRKLENSVTNSFATLSCLQSDFSVVLKKCSKIDLLIDEMAALKLSIAAKDGGLPLESSVSSAKDLQTDDNSSSSGTEVSDTETESESDDEFPSLNHENNNDDLQSTHVDNPPATHKHPPIPDDSMTDGGYQLVGNGGKPYKRVFTNSAIRSKQRQQAGGLKAAQRGHNNNYCSIFVSNLTTDTKSCGVTDFLFKKYQLRFKVIQIPSKYKDCVSFKVVIPCNMKDSMLDKKNWTRNVYLREFYENSRSLATLSAQ